MISSPVCFCHFTADMASGWKDDIAVYVGVEFLLTLFFGVERVKEKIWWKHE